MNIYTGLLFLDGHIANDTLARQLTDAGPTDTPVDNDGGAGKAPPTAGARTICRTGLIARALDLFALLGGRPMTAGHNTDVDEALPMPASCRRILAAGGVPAAIPRPARPRPPRRQPACSYCA